MTSGFTRFFKSFCAVQHYVNVRVVSSCKSLIVPFAGAKVRRFFNSANFLALFFEVFLRRMVKWLEINSYGEEVFLGGMGRLGRLGGLGRVGRVRQVGGRAARAIMGQVGRVRSFGRARKAERTGTGETSGTGGTGGNKKSCLC